MSNESNACLSLKACDDTKGITMCSTIPESNVSADPGKTDKVPCTKSTRDLHVKGVPENVWRRARVNATLSGMTFKEFIIATLARCGLIPERSENALTMVDDEPHEE